jgi:hypothetical protein
MKSQQAGISLSSEHAKPYCLPVHGCTAAGGKLVQAGEHHQVVEAVPQRSREEKGTIAPVFNQ